MPTQEERLLTLEFNLEHFKTETIKAYGEMAMEFVIVKGLGEDGVKRLIALKRTADEHTVLLNKQSERLDRIEATLGSHSERLGRIEATLGDHSAVLNGHSAILNEHTAVLNGHSAILNEHTARFDRLETMLTQILARLPEKL